jgi:ketosteroid isomerase-like protein
MAVDGWIQELYDGFNARDAEAVLRIMTEDVDWPNGWEGGWVRGRDAVREYWARQWAAIDPTVEPLAIDPRPDGVIAVRVHQVVCDIDGRLMTEGEVTHVYEMRDGLVARMTIEA